jgi:hypothetical protein
MAFGLSLLFIAAIQSLCWADVTKLAEEVILRLGSWARLEKSGGTAA